jgi:ribosomal protein L37E
MSGFEAHYHCKKCGDHDVMVNPIKMSNDVLQIQAFCHGCGQKAFLSHNKTNEEWRMPFGKYKGMTITDIKDENPAYIEWAALNFTDEKIRQRFEDEL